jgi:MinD-like ATPase involved in chromosome partitioning or flagellar assembly
VTHIVTFYSFKGGVGRTMTLVNTAYALAKLGARVLMVDFDLEAPGMTHFFGAAGQGHRKGATRDALDLLLEAKRSLRDAASGEAQISAPLSLNDYILQLEPPRPGDKTFSPYLASRVDLLPATLESPARTTDEGDALLSSDYLERIAKLDLPGIFGPDGPGHLFGEHVGEYFRNARFEAPGDLLFTLRNRVHAAYDFILVDSRTGLNEISGLCIGPLCDSVVICTGLNEQNLVGTRYFLEQTGLLDKEKGKPYLVVAGPVPPWRTEESEARLDAIRRDLAAERVIEVPYHPAAALAERVFVLDEHPEPIAGSFAAVAQRIMATHLGAIVPRITTALRDLANPGALSDHSDEIAAIPSTCRLMRSPEIAGQLAWPPFPTPLVSVLLSQVFVSRGEPLLMAVAVALPRRLSVTFTKRVKLLLDFLNLGSEERSRLVVAIAFFYTRLHGKKGRALLAEHLSAEDKRVLTDVISKKPVRLSFELAGLALRHVSGEDCDLGQAEKELIHLRYPRWLHAEQWGPPLYELLDKRDVWWELWKANYCDTELEMTAGMERLVRTIADATKSNSWMKFRERSLDSYYRHDIGAPGFSLILAIGAAIADLRGPTAVNLVLKCIEMGRWGEGYAWRAMINWKRLKRVHSCPEFKDFLTAEDAAVAHVEAQFDEGIWPL